jgi:hypothetical protein
VVLPFGSDPVVRRLRPNGTPVEKAETVVAERPDANNRPSRQQSHPFPNVPDRGNDMGFEALNDRPASQVHPAYHLIGDGPDGAHFNNAPRARPRPRPRYPGEGPAAAAHISIGAGEIWKGQELAIDGPTEVGAVKLC